MGACAPSRRGALRKLSALLACLVVLASGAAARAQGDSLEYAVKATYLYKFAPFVEWPEGTFPSPSSTLRLCVVGDDPFGAILDRAVRSQSVDERAIELRRLRTADRDSGCHIMYVAGSGAQSVAQALDAVHGTPVLTVTDAAIDDRAKGIVHFVVQDNRVRFEIDDYTAWESGIRISSRVLSLATFVRHRP